MDNKKLLERLEVEQRGKLSDHGTMEKKMTELVENEKRLGEEVEVLKQERDKKLVEYQRSLEKERETYKSKLNDAETKTKEAEGKRNSLIFEFEKERAKWALEKDHLNT